MTHRLTHRGLQGRGRGCSAPGPLGGRRGGCSAPGPLGGPQVGGALCRDPWGRATPSRAAVPLDLLRPREASAGPRSVVPPASARFLPKPIDPCVLF